MRLGLLCLLIFCATTSAQIAVHIEGAPAVSLSDRDLAQLPAHSAILKDHGQTVTYEGPLMHDVLAKAGVDFGKPLHGKQLALYVAATGTDGYQVVYALSEFDPSLTDSGIIVALTRERQALSTTEAPFRIVVPNDKRPARSLRMLKEIDVIKLTQETAKP